ncbi:TssA family type VI secretion system protein [Aquisalimonas asiatica]|uniref:Type VI secretion system protein VasJ n=1 Tax=Aquisalimonas asiatica TaxID=406100 RepID=A0A1H8UJI4_9GAMM|nr:TssA family type VI secretion system protein [Aquisalimonas asiatica]SEP03123.1 type VI secretion system protein VasJ [Aquisalimonas asiatica]
MTEARDETDTLQARVLAPLPDHDPGAAGDDPKHGVRFAGLKEEVQKLSGNDFERVSELATEVLTQEGKDLRVLGYLCLAELHQRGLAGLRDSLDTVRAAVNQYWESIHPQRLQGRVSALEWLANDRMVAFLDLAGDRDDKDTLEGVQHALDALGEALAERLDAPPSFRPLRDWLEARLATSRAAENRQRAAQKEKQDEAAKPASERDLSRQLRSALDYLRKEGEWRRMVGLARAWKWAGLDTLAAEGGVTQIQSPRPQALDAIRVKLDEGAWDDAFIACENAFLEPGGHLAMGIQAWADQAAVEMGRPDIARAIRAATADLLSRLPDLPQLRFADEQPMVPPDIAKWLAGVRGGDTSDGDEPDLAQRLGHARTAVRTEGLGAAMRLLDAVACRSDRERAALALGRAKVCVDAGRSDLALPLLDELDRDMEQRGIARWDPEFALDVWRTMQLALRHPPKGGAAMGREEIRQRMAALKARVALTDVEAAAGFQ